MKKLEARCEPTLHKSRLRLYLYHTSGMLITRGGMMSMTRSKLYVGLLRFQELPQNLVLLSKDMTLRLGHGGRMIGYG